MKLKYNGSTVHRMALLHVIGKLEQMNGYATLAEIAGFMNCTKQTAMKHIKSNIDNQEILKEECAYRSNAKMYKFYLFEDMKDEYRQGLYKDAYRLYSQLVLGVGYGK